MGSIILTLLVGLTLPAPAPAQTGSWRFRWHSGQVLLYRAEHATQVTEVVGGNKVETASKLTVTKRWHVTNVDAQGIATLEMSLVSMRNEQTRPGGEVLIYDSANPKDGTPELGEQLSKYLGKTLAEIRVDGFGQVVDVKQGAANRFESELPFAVIVPRVVPQPGQAWERQYKVVLDPPHGTGEKFDATQRFVCKKTGDGVAVIAITTQFKNQPDSQLERVPLLQKQPEGEVTFDLQAGRMFRASLRIDKSLEDHQGKGSSYRFQSTYTEQYVGAK
jgi:hypothetical protein